MLRLVLNRFRSYRVSSYRVSVRAMVRIGFVLG